MRIIRTLERGDIDRLVHRRAGCGVTFGRERIMDMLDTAIELAARAHRGQLRKGTDVPYIAHPFGVGLILARAGYDEEVIIAGILHDTVEDTDVTLERVEETFGARVAAIVRGCSEPDKDLPWEDRKHHTIEQLATASIEVQAVTCADKLHNVRSLMAALREEGPGVWARFNRGREQQAWYYRGLAEVFRRREGELFQSFATLVDEVFPPAGR